MARACVLSIVLAAAAAAAACRPEHEPAPIPTRPPQSLTHETRAAAPPSTVKVAVLEPSGSGNWGGALELVPAPASLVAPCLAPDATGWVSVDVDTHNDAASTTSIVEASADTSAELRACIAHALTGVHTKFDAMRVLVYVTFSPR
jgi:hypothetical protein